MVRRTLSWVIFGSIVLVILAIGLLIGSGPTVDLEEVFDAEIEQCHLNIKQQGEGVTTEIVLSGTLTALEEVDVVSLTVDGFVTIGEGEPESIGTANLNDRLFRPGDTWDFMLTDPAPSEGFTLSGCSVDIDATMR